MVDLIPAGAKRGVVVVAHPDDEALWCGGLLSRGDAIEWTIICCTVPRHDPIRAHKFFDSCRVFGAYGRLLPFTEIEPIRFDLLDLDQFDVIFTHGAAGEYGHRQHIELHEFISSRWPEKSRYFGYRKTGRGIFDVPFDEAMKASKLEALKSYDHCSPTDRGKPKWQALLDVFEPQFDLWRETFD